MRPVVLVTGATGTIGGALARRLVRDGHRVRALVRGDGIAAAGLRDAGVDLVGGDVRDLSSLRSAMRGCTHVAHLAARRTGPGVRLPDYRATNVQGTRNVARGAGECGVQRVVYSSTVGVYGFIDGATVDEGSPIRPNTHYRLSKWEGELALREEASAGGIETVIARLSSAVGAGTLNWIPFMRAIRARGLRLVGDGANRLDLVDCDDMVDALVRCLFTPGVGGGVFVIGADAPLPFRDFVRLIADEQGVPAPAPGPPRWPYVLLLKAAGESYRHFRAGVGALHARELLVADKLTSSARARRELGYRPSVPAETAVRRMAQQFGARG